MGTILADLLIGELPSEHLRTDLRQVQCLQGFVDAVDDGVQEFHGIVLITQIHRFPSESREREREIGETPERERERLT